LVLEVRGLSKDFLTCESEDLLPVLANISFRVEAGEFLSIVGPSGCGKTTLLRVISGLEKASEGDILLNGEALAGNHPSVGLVFQEYALFPWRTALRNVEFGLEVRGVKKSERRIAALRYLNAFGLEGSEHAYPKHLSGGMKQRVAIARALIANPAVVLMDEPFGSLDSQTRNHMQSFLLEVWLQRKDTIIFVTHNVDEAVFLSSRILVLSKRPAQVLETFIIDLPRPRDRTGHEANLIMRQISELL